MPDANQTISLRLVAQDNATPVIERVRAALADLGAGVNLGGLQEQLAGIEGALVAIGATSLGELTGQVHALTGDLAQATEEARQLAGALNEAQAAGERLAHTDIVPQGLAPQAEAPFVQEQAPPEAPVLAQAAQSAALEEALAAQQRDQQALRGEWPGEWGAGATAAHQQQEPLSGGLSGVQGALLATAVASTPAPQSQQLASGLGELRAAASEATAALRGLAPVEQQEAGGLTPGSMRKMLTGHLHELELARQEVAAYESEWEGGAEALARTPTSLLGAGIEWSPPNGGPPVLGAAPGAAGGDPWAGMTQAVREAMAKMQAEVASAMAVVKAEMAHLVPSGTSSGAAAGGTAGPFEQMVELVRLGMREMVDAMQGARNALIQAGKDMALSTSEAMAKITADAAGSGADGVVGAGGRGHRAGAAEGGLLGGMLAERGILGEKGLVRGGFEVPGLELAKQFIVWGGLFGAVMQATQAVHTFADGLISTNSSYEDLKATLTTLYGGPGHEATAQRALDYLDVYAEKTPATREQVRQSGVSFAAVGDNMQLMVPAAERISTAMRNPGGLTSATQAIVDMQFGRSEMLRQNLKLTIPELEKYGLQVEKNGHVVQGTFIPAIERMTGVLNDQWMQAQHQKTGLVADPRFINSIDLAMKTLSGTVSNLGDIGQETQRRLGAGLFGSLEKWLAPVVAGMGDPKGAGGAITGIADQLGHTMGDALTSGLHSLSAWWDKLGGLPGLIRLVDQTWATFTSTIKAFWPAVQGVGDAIGAVWDTVKLVTDALGGFFGMFGGAGGDMLRTGTATIAALVLELKLLATVLAPLNALWTGLTGAIGANTVAEEANALAAGTDAGAQEGAAAAGGAGLLGRLGRMAKGPGSLLAAEGPLAVEEAVGGAEVVGGATVAGGALSALGTGLSGLAMTALAVVGPLAAVAAGVAALGEMSGGWFSSSEKKSALAIMPSQANTFAPLPVGTPTPLPNGLLPVPTATPMPGTQASMPPAVPGPVAGQGAYATGPSRAATFAAGLPKDAQAVFWEAEKGDTGKWLSYIAAHPAIGQRWVDEMTTEGKGPKAKTLFDQAVYGTPPTTPEQQAAQLWQSARVAAKMPERRGELYGDLYQLQTLREQQDTAGGMTDAGKIAADIARTITTPFMRQFHRFIPKSEGGTLPETPGGGTTPADLLAQAAQSAQQQVQWDEALKVPYTRFKKDMDAATSAMRAAGDPKDAVSVFYKQHMDAWAQAQSQLAEHKLSVDEALHKPYATISADMDALAGTLKAQGDSNNDEIAAKLGAAIDQYFDGLIQATDAQRSALQTVGASPQAQLAQVSLHQQDMRDDNAKRAARGLPPRYTPEEIQAAGLSGAKEVYGNQAALASTRLDLDLTQHAAGRVPADLATYRKERTLAGGDPNAVALDILQKTQQVYGNQAQQASTQLDLDLARHQWGRVPADLATYRTDRTLAGGDPNAITLDILQKSQQVAQQRLSADQETLHVAELAGADWGHIATIVGQMTSDAQAAHQTQAQILLSDTDAIKAAGAAMVQSIEQRGGTEAQAMAAVRGERAQLLKIPGMTPQMADRIVAQDTRGVQETYRPQVTTALQTQYQTGLEGGQITTPAQVMAWTARLDRALAAQPAPVGEQPWERTARLQAAHLAYGRQGYAALTGQDDARFQFDAGQPNPQMATLQRDTKAEIAVYGRELHDHLITRDQYNTDVQQARKRLEDAFPMARQGVVPSPVYGHEGAFSQATSYGGAVAHFGGVSLRTDGTAEIIRQLQQQLHYWERRATHDEAMLAAARGTQTNTARTASTIAGLVDHMGRPIPVPPSPQSRMRVAGNSIHPVRA